MAVLVGLGLHGAVTLNVGRGTWGRRDSATISLIVILVGSFVTFVVVAVIARIPTVATALQDLSAELIAVSVGAVLAHTLGAALLKGQRRFGDLARLGVLSAALNLVVFFILWFAGLRPVFAATVGWIAGQGLLALGLLLRGAIDGGFSCVLPDGIGSGVRFGVKTAAVNLVNQMNLRLDVLVLSALAGTYAVGQYSLAVQVAEIPWALSAAVGTIVFPTVASRGDDLGEWTARVCGLSVVALLVSSVAVTAAGGLVVWFWLPEFKASIAPMVLLVPGTVAVGVGRVLGNDAYGRGLASANLVGVTSAVVVTLIGNIIFTPIHGVQAAAAVSSVAYMVYAAVMIRDFVSRTGIRARTVLVVRPGDVRATLGVFTTKLLRMRS